MKEPVIESLVSIRNLKDVRDVKSFIKKANILEDVLLINQVENKQPVLKYKEENIRTISFNEKGVARSRNRALEYANGDICLFTDDDIKYENNYKDIVLEAYNKYKKADMIIFYVESLSKDRKLKKIKDGKIHWIDIMRVVSSEITFKINEMKDKKINFNENFGPGGSFLMGEETVFLNECLKKGLKIYSVPVKIGTVENKESTWFKGYNEKYFYDQGAIFKELQPKLYKLLILQYVLRKYSLYKDKFKMKEIYAIMNNGAKHK